MQDLESFEKILFVGLESFGKIFTCSLYLCVYVFKFIFSLIIHVLPSNVMIVMLLK